MNTTVLPELAAESVETADRLVRLSAGEHLDTAEAEYLLGSGLAALERLPQLWPIVRRRIGAGTTADMAQQLLAQLLGAMDRNLALASVLKDLARSIREETGQEPEATNELATGEARLRAIRAEAVHLLRSVEAPARWPGEQQLNKAKEQMQRGNRLSAEEFRRALLGE